MKKIVNYSAMFVLLSAVTAFCRTDTYSDFQKTFTVSGGGKLVVSVSMGDIRIRTWDKSQVQMTVRNIGDDADRIETSQTGNTLTVKYKVHGGWWSSDRDLVFEFNIPNDFNLDLNTSGGDIDLGGSIKGAVKISTSGGDLKIEDVDGTVEGRTSGGDIDVHNVTRDAELSTSGGDIRIERAEANLDISTSGGEITVGTVGKDLTASTSGGNIDIRSVGGELRANTSSGDVTVGKVGGSVQVSTSGGDISLSSGNGSISANTSGGDVNISAATGSVDVSSSGGTVKVGLIPKAGGESRVESSGGDVYLYIPSDAKATIHIDVSGGEEDAVNSDFPVTIQKKSQFYGNQKAEIVLNGGGQDIYLHTSSGSVYVRRLVSH